MTLQDILRRIKEKIQTNYENIKIKEPEMSSIIYEVDTLCHSIRREFERYEDEGIFEIDRIYKSTEKIDDFARKIDDYEEEISN